MVFLLQWLFLEEVKRQKDWQREILQVKYVEGDTASTYIVPLKRRSRAVVLTHVLDRVCRSNYFRRPLLPFRRPHCAAPRINSMWV